MHGLLAPLILYLTTGPMSPGVWRPPELAVAQRAPATFEELKEIAFSYLGRPYHWGGNGRPGFDCSGFTCRVFAEGGYGIPRVSRDQARVGDAVPMQQLAPGDLVFFVSEPGRDRITHVALYLGGREMIHAASGQGRVVLDSIDRRYYRHRLIEARRILGEPGVEGGPRAPRPLVVGPPGAAHGTGTSTAPVVRELAEHVGEDELPITQRLPDRMPAPSLGPQIAWRRTTSIAMRVAALTEDGVLGLTLVPEATLSVESWALELAVAVPVRFELHEDPTIGRLETFGDWTRFLRTAAVGLPGADLEVRLDRLGEATLARGFVVDRLAPGSVSSGVPGLSVSRTPLSLFAAYRGGPLTAELLAADVADFSLFGVGLGWPVLGGFEVRGAFASDQKAGAEGAPRAVNAAELSATYELAGRSWGFVGELMTGAIRAQSELGAAGALTLGGEYRLDRGVSALRFELEVAWLGPGFLASVFGPTYLAARPAHLDALASAAGRWSLQGELTMRYGRLAVGAGYGDGLAAHSHLLDRRLFALAQVEALSLGGTRLLDMRVAYAARGAFGPRDRGANDVLHTALRLRLNGWLATELYVEKSDRFEGGVGVTAAWEP